MFKVGGYVHKVEGHDLSEKALEERGICISNGNILFENDPHGWEGGRIVNLGSMRTLSIQSILFESVNFAVHKDNIDDLILALWLAKQKFL